MSLDLDHLDDCECEICKHGPEKYREWEASSLLQYGWYAHYVVHGDDQTPTGTNYHTHGISDSYGQLDFQIVLHIDPKIAHALFSNVVALLKEGKRFKSGDVVSEVANLPVLLISARECGRDVLRIVLPDELGSLSNAEMDEVYAVQHEVLI
jgi:hypothetical protein